MRDAARTLASYGRNGDNMLVHVSRKELEGIRALTGRDFTQNPDTGLPEAFNFANLLPLAAGIGASVLTGGAAIPAALAAGATSAGVTAAQGGSLQDSLTSGLISGATSYAGGQILSGVGDAAGAASSTGISSPVSDPGFMGQVAATPSVPAAGAAAPGLMDTMATRASDFGTRLSNIASDPGAAASKIGENIAARPFSALVAGGGTLMQAGDMMGGGPEIPGQTPYDASRYPERFPTNPRQWNAPPSGYRAGAGPEYRYFAKGGLTSMRSEDGYTANLMNEAKAAILGEHPRPREAMERFREAFGEDALSMLRDRLTGGQVRGAGSGMDDLVPGTIEGRQKVRLADGEFVLPAHIVSAIGDGSTDHGVRRLKGMMDSIYRQKYKSGGLPRRLKKGTLPDE